jgi:PAS domain S-box-containing protein
MAGEYRRYQLGLLNTVVHLINLLVVAVILANISWFFVAFWDALVQDLLFLLFFPLGLWCRRMADRGRYKLAVRGYLGAASFIFIILIMTLGEFFLLHSAMGLAVIALLGVFLDDPRLSWRWGLVGSAVHLFSLGLRAIVPALEFDHDLPALLALITFPLILIAVLTAIGYRVSQHLRRALEASAASQAQMEKELDHRRRVESRLQLISSAVSQSTEGIAVSDMKGRVLFANPAWAQMHGYPSADAVIGLHYTVFHTPEQQDDIQGFGESLKERGFFGGEVGHVRRDGSTFPARLHATVLHDDEGEPAGTITTLVDISEQKALEAQIQQSQKMEAIGRLAGGVAHDFNNLLTGIISYIELALTDIQAPQVRDDLKEALDAANRAADLTRQLLTFSRKQLHKVTVLDLNNSVKSVEKMLESLIGADVTLRFLLDPDVGAVRANAGQVGQVLINLVVNAREAMEKGGEIIIRTDPVTLPEDRPELDVAPGAYVRLSVTDTGPGIPPEIMPHLFEPFFTTKEEGTGLGLSTVYGAIQSIGGDIAVETEPGEGTTFCVYWPVAQEGVAPSDQQPSAGPEPGSERILLVEDEKVVRDLAARILSRRGYEIWEAASGEEALALLKQKAGPPDLLVTDLVMPGIRGTELARRLRARYPTLPILYISGYTDDTIPDPEELGPNEKFLPKPFDARSLPEAVRELLDDGS